MRRMRNTEVYRERRRAAAAVLIAIIATLLDAISNKGSGWPFLQAFGLFLVLAAGPLVLTRVLDTFMESEDDAPHSW